MNAHFAALLLSIILLGTSCWGRFCEHPTSTSRCGLNQRGTRTRTCAEGEWSEPGPCVDPDVCVNGTVDSTSHPTCGLNNRGVTTTRTCTAGQWVVACDDPDVCVDGEVEQVFCGPLATYTRQCTAGQWVTTIVCDDVATLTISAPGRRDMVHDAGRNRLYITTTATDQFGQYAGEVLVYDLLKRKFEQSLFGGGDFAGIDISPDGTYLFVASEQGWVNGLHLATRQFTGVGVPPLGTKTFSVAFISNTEALVTATGSSSVPLFRVNVSTQVVDQIATVRPDTMLSPAAGGSTVGFAQPNSAAGEWGRYEVATRTLANTTLGKSVYEIALSRDAALHALLTQEGLQLVDRAPALQAMLGTSTEVPIAAAFSPVADEIYVAWTGASTSLDVYSTTTFQKLRDIEPAPGRFSPVNGRAFVEGRLRVSRDGRLLFVTMGDNVVAYLTGR